MNSREKGLVSLVVMAALSAGLILGSDSIYTALKSLEVSAGSKGGYQPGTYQGTGKGFGGDVEVSVTVNGDGSLGDITVMECSGETPGIGQTAAPEVAKAILAAQSPEVDSVTGATITSEGIKEAAAKALALASGQTEEETEKTVFVEEDTEAVTGATVQAEENK